MRRVAQNTESRRLNRDYLRCLMQQMRRHAWLKASFFSPIITMPTASTLSSKPLHVCFIFSSLLAKKACNNTATRRLIVTAAPSVSKCISSCSTIPHTAPSALSSCVPSAAGASLSREMTKARCKRRAMIHGRINCTAVVRATDAATSIQNRYASASAPPPATMPAASRTHRRLLKCHVS
jgi:hypothetical protein